MERRAIHIEVRSARDNPRRLEGYAATFGTEARVADFVETIRAGAFARSLASGRDILAFVDHDPVRILGRTASGTLRLSEDSRGLAFSLDVPETTLGRDILALAERGDLGGMSFGFRVPKGGDDMQGYRRELRAIDLFEVSVVSAWPAYPGTKLVPRSKRRSEPGDGMRHVLARWRA
jgi:HK97 family phage prohead protease